MVAESKEMKIFMMLLSASVRTCAGKIAAVQRRCIMQCWLITLVSKSPASSVVVPCKLSLSGQPCRSWPILSRVCLSDVVMFFAGWPAAVKELSHFIITTIRVKE